MKIKDYIYWTKDLPRGNPWTKEKGVPLKDVKEFIKQLKESFPNLLFENNPEPEQRAYQTHKIIDLLAGDKFK